MAEVMKPEILDSCPVEQALKASFHALASARCPWPRRKNPIFTNYDGEPS